MPTSYDRDPPSGPHGGDPLRGRPWLWPGLFRTGLVGVALLDDTGRFLRVNDTLCEYLGRTRADLTALRLADVVHPDDRGHAMEPVTGSPALAGGAEPDTREYRYVHRDGRVLRARSATERLDVTGGQLCTLMHVADVTPLRAVETRLRHAQHHDRLTGLPDRTRAVERLRDLLAGGPAGGGDAGAADGPPPVGVVVVDLDDFRRVNDSLGHDAGDELLVEVGRRLRALASAGDLVARIGGDQFAVVHHGGHGPTGDFAVLAGRVLDSLNRPIRVDRHEVVVSASVGIAVDTAGTSGAHDLLRYADAALLRAKRWGGARFVFGEASLCDAARDRMDLELQLRSALTRDELALHYQPVVDAEGTVVSVEALVRWPHPQRGLLAPTAFLPVSEPSDLSAALDRWVVHNAAVQLARWHAAFPALPLTVAVNVSPAHLLRDDCALNLSRALAGTGVPPGDVCVEIPERQVVGTEPDRSSDHVDRLRDLGVRLAIDDFGVGCFGLEHLTRLPTEVLKIDRSLVEGLGRRGPARSILGAVVTMAHATGRTCVAEGVETAHQWRELVALGCDLLQGYYFSRPLPAGQLTRLLSAGARLPAG